MVIGRRIAYNVIVNVIAKAGSTVLALVAIGMITRYLGPSGFGDYATIMAFFALAAALADFGLYQVMTREIGRSEDAAQEQRIVERIFTLRLLLSSAVTLGTVAVVQWLPYTPSVRAGIILIAVAFFFSSSYSLLNGVFQKHLRMDLVVVTEFIGKALQVAWIWGVMVLDGGFLWVVASVIAAMLFDFVAVLTLARRYVTPRIVTDVPFWRDFLSHSYPMGIAAIVTFLYFKADTLILAHLQDAAAVGIYNGAYKIMENLIFFPSMVMGLMLPILARTIFTDRNQFTVYADKTLKVFLIIIVPIVIGVLFEAEAIMRVVGGEAFVASAPVLRLLIWALFFIFFGQFFTILLLTGKLQKLLLGILSVIAVANIAANVLLIPLFSYIGAAWVSVGTEAAVVAACAVAGILRLDYRPHIPQFWRIIVAGGLMTVALLWLSHLPLAATILGSGVVYAAALWLTRAVGADEIRGIIARRAAADGSTASGIL